MKKIVLALCGVCFMSGIAVAENEVTPVVYQENESYFYGGLGLSYDRVYSTDSGWFDDGILTQDEVGGLTGILGYNYNEYLAIEGRLGLSLWSRDYADLTTWSLFIKPQYYLDRNFKIYGLLGVGNSTVEGYDGDTPAHPNMVGVTIMDETGFQWGLGMSYDVIGDWTVFIDYTMTADDAGINATLYEYDPVRYDKLSSDALTVGMTYRF